MSNLITAIPLSFLSNGAPMRRDNVGSLGRDRLGQGRFDPYERQPHVVRSGGKARDFR